MCLFTATPPSLVSVPFCLPVNRAIVCLRSPSLVPFFYLGSYLTFSRLSPRLFHFGKYPVRFLFRISFYFALLVV